MADEFIEPLTPNTILSAQEIDELVSQFRLHNRRLSQQQANKLFSELPLVTEADLIASGLRDDVCPICFNTFRSILAEEEVARAMDTPAHPIEELGVTKLRNTCGHIFCRKDIIKWITDGHDSCPSCRQSLISVDESRETTLFPQPDENWLRPWLVDSDMVARHNGLPLPLPTLTIDSVHDIGNVTENTRPQFTGMYS